jgi:hypothetical protein
MDTTFLRVLSTEEWNYIARRFHGERRRSNDSYHIGCPRMAGENANIIPIHYEDNHRINVIRRELTSGKVTFFMLTISTEKIQKLKPIDHIHNI